MKLSDSESRSNFRTQRLNEDYAADMRALNVLFGEVFDDPERYRDNPPNDTYIKQFLNSSSHIVIVATDNGKVIGGLVAYVLDKFEMERREVYIYDLAVAGDYQRQGIGARLIAKLKEAARKAGAYVIFVQADEGDDAVYFYRSLKPSEEIQARNFDLDV